MPILRAIPICIVGNILPIPFILLLIRHVLEWMKKVSCFRGIALWLERKAMSKKGQIEKYEFWGLMLFVGIPLPGTGAWTGALVASLLHMKFGKAFGAIFSRYRAGDGDYVDSVLRRAGRAAWMMHR